MTNNNQYHLIIVWTIFSPKTEPWGIPKFIIPCFDTLPSVSADGSHFYVALKPVLNPPLYNVMLTFLKSSEQ